VRRQRQFDDQGRRRRHQRERSHARGEHERERRRRHQARQGRHPGRGPGGRPAGERLVSFQATTSSGASGPTYKLQVTVESIKKGSLKDFNGIQLNANEKASTPYYATVRITNVGPTSFNTSSNDPAISVEGVDDTGNTDTSVTFFGTFPPCPDADTPNPLRAGQSFQTCLTYLVPGGITKVAYTGTDAYETSPVTWTLK